MFKIPAWEDDGPKTESTFIQKNKEKIEIKTKSWKDNHVKEKNNNVSVNGLKHTTRKRKIEHKEIIKSKKHTVSTKKNKCEETDAISETQNFDEILLNAKKKKLNEVIEKDDKEDLLFTESKHKKEKKIKAKISPNNLSVNNKPIKDRERRVTKQNNKKNSIVNGEVKQNNKVNEEIDSTITEVNERFGHVNNKKTRLRSLLGNIHRTPINNSNAGNKLRDRMLERLKAAQFRYLNEKLYTSSGSEAQQLFQSDPTAFETYHQGYQLQVKKWPVNPLDVIVKKILKMPKTHTIADLGCGEAALSRRVPHKVRSFDLVATAPGVEACDMARTPLLTASIDVTVYCLALMGTDLTQYLVEANRVLKMGGHLLIAEVESRFDKVENFAKEVERLGFKLKQLDKSNNVFFFMEFTKIREPPVKKAKLPALSLKPCLYKRR